MTCDQRYNIGPGRGNGQKSPVLDPDLDERLRNIAKIAQAAGATPLTVSAMEQYAEDTVSFEVGLRMQMTMDAMRELARYLSTIPGRKNLIGFPARSPQRSGPIIHCRMLLPQNAITWRR